METHWDYTAEDLMTTAPYEELYRWREEPFLHAARLESLAAHAQAVGVPGFRTMYRRYVQSVEGPGGGTAEGHLTAFTGQPLELDAGEWEAGDDGVRRRRPGGGEEVACPHPLLPVERLVDLDTGEEKLKLAFCKGGVWRQVVAPRTVLANAGRVTELAGTGMGVTSQTARAFVSYLAEVEQRNYERIPERRCVSRLGHIPGVGFAPYVEGLAFDGDPSLRALFQTVRAKGSEAAWLETARAVRDMSAQARILLAASFASVLLEPLGCLPFFVHLWGVESGSGKTVALMAAASVWGDPAPGAYVKTFDGTVTGLEKTAAFLSHLPLCLDELQLAKDERGRTCFDVYRLAQGVGRTRGTRTGGLEPTATWRLYFTTQSPILSLLKTFFNSSTENFISASCHTSILKKL